MRVLLTGSAGFIGFHVARALLERGDEVIGYDNFNPYYDPRLKERRNAILEEQPNFRLVRADIGDREAVQDAFDDLVRGASGTETRVCHLAAQAGVRHSIDQPNQFVRDNVQAFTYVLELCRDHEVGGLVYASSSSVYGNSTLDDIVTGVVSAIDRNHEDLVCNLAAGRTEELMEFIRQIERSCGREGDKEFLPMQPGDVVRTSADLTRAREYLGYEPTTEIADGIPRFVDWYREYYGL